MKTPNCMWGAAFWAPPIILESLKILRLIFNHPMVPWPSEFGRAVSGAADCFVYLDYVGFELIPDVQSFHDLLVLDLELPESSIDIIVCKIF